MSDLSGPFFVTRVYLYRVLMQHGSNKSAYVLPCTRYVCIQVRCKGNWVVHSST